MIATRLLSARSAVARSPSQSPNDENAIEFQSFLKAGIDKTERESAWAGAPGYGIDCVIGGVYRELVLKLNSLNKAHFRPSRQSRFRGCVRASTPGVSEP